MGTTWGTILFVYGILFVLVCMVATSVSICSYLVTHRRIHLGFALFFLFDMFESALVFLDEYLGVKAVYSIPLHDFPMSHPMLKLLFSCGLLASVWLLALGITDRFDKRRFVLAWGPFVLLESLSLLIPGNSDKQLVFYVLRSVSMLCALAMVFLVSARTEDRGLKSYLEQCRPHFRVLSVLVVLVLLEDVAHLSSLFSGFLDLLGGDIWYRLDLVYVIAGRNLSENILTFYLAFTVIKSCSEVLALRFDDPPTTETSTAKQHAEQRFEHFCRQRDISTREADVLRLMLEGKANRVIAEELYISQGTVKAHVHAIYKKCGVNDRKSLLQLFWAD